MERIQVGKAAYPLTKPQLSIWHMEQFYGGAVAGITGSVLFQHPVSIDAIQVAISRTIRQCNSLRLRVQTEAGSPTQFVDDLVPTQFPVERFASQAEFDSWAQVIAHTPIDLTGPLYQFFVVEAGPQKGVLLHLHHLTADAWTLNLLANVLQQNLADESVTTGNYLDYLREETNYAASPRAAKDAAYFRQCLQQCDEPVYLADKPARRPQAERLSLAIGADDSARLQRFCYDHDISPYSLFMTGLAVYLGRIKRASRFYLGTTVANRAGTIDKQTAGVFINTVPVLMGIDYDASVLDNLDTAAVRLTGVFRHQRCSYTDILNGIRQDNGFTGRLFDVVLNYQEAALDGDGMAARWYFCGSQGDTLAIHVSDRQREGRFNLDYDFQTESLTHWDVKRLHGHLMNLLLDTIDHPEKKPWQLKLLNDNEYAQVTVGFNDTAVEYPRECVHGLFEQQVERTPEATAVIFHGVEYSYGQINAMANAVARRLRATGVGKGDIVAIVARRTYRIIVAQLAALKAGGCYLPVDPSYPSERIAFMLTDANCRAVLLDAAGVGLPVNTPAIDISECDGQADEANPVSTSTPDDLCYVIYTSGSTGQPKGVMIRHRNIANYCANNDHNVVRSIMTPEMNTILSTTTMCFDIFVTESLLALTNGKTAILADEQQCVDQRSLDRLARQTQPDVLQTTPSKMRALTQDEEYSGYLRGLKAIILGGEVLDQPLVDHLRQHTEARLYNIYGPTETTVWSTNAPVVGPAGINIGQPIANTQVYILDSHLNPQPIGAVGELVIGGDGVGAGYLNLADLTAEKFVLNPFHSGVMYKTGDLARWRENGDIEYIGRADRQVKLRGLRVELGEIEARLAQCAGVRQSAVVIHDNDGHQYLCAYYTGGASTVQLRDALARALPQYMVPNYFVNLSSMPITPSGKLDSKALRPPNPASTRSGVTAPPRTEQEQILAGLIQMVLRIQLVGLDDDFFELGGDSLSAIELVTKAQSAGFGFSLQEIFDRPNIRALLSPTAHSASAASPNRTDVNPRIGALLARNQGVPKLANPRRPIGDVLITGATGWLGAHVLDEYLAQQSGLAYCLVRGASLPEASVRLAKTLHALFGDRYDGSARLVPVLGDITESLTLTQPVNTVIHCAADVRHFGSSQESQRVNVEGTKNVARLAESMGARLLHISTTTVSGNGLTSARSQLTPAVFDETKLDVGQSLDNRYVHSKIDAEIAVLEARLAGLDAQIARVGNLSNRDCDLMFQRNHTNNATVALLKALVDLGCYPADWADVSLEFSPVDSTARALLTLLSGADAGYSVFHICNQPVRLADFVEACNRAGLVMAAVGEAVFASRLREVELGGPAQALLEQASGLSGGFKVRSDFTRNLLAQAGFEWPAIGPTYLDGYVRYFINLGFWGRHAEEP